ncbi:lysophospholipid acyltransferase family protein [bacterium]|nr:lysophospholipid acyltransferase family protein [bacterium]
MRKKVKHTIIYLGLRVLIFITRLLPYAVALWLGGVLGATFHDLVPKERTRAWNNLAIAFPEAPVSERKRITRRLFISLGKNALELFKMFSYTSEKIARLVTAVEGAQHLAAAHAQKKGVLCLTAHLGNWEILPIFVKQQGWSSAAVAQALYDERLDILLNNFRESHGVPVIKRQQVTRDIIRSLRENRLLGILNDQDTGVDSRFAPFFGKMAKTPIGIFRLARKLSCPVVPVFITRQKDGKNKVFIEPALEVPVTQDEEKDLVECARLCNAAIEKFVRQFPDQWVWFHQRWKSQPPEAGA